MTEEVIPTIWSQRNCQPCRAVTRWMDKYGPDYQVKLLEDNLDKLDEFRAQEFLESPVVEFPGFPIFTGFNPTKLQEATDACEGRPEAA